MEVVAHFLQLQAIDRAVQSEKDQFGRSSYNRYYYATFLHARDLLTRLDQRWSELPHADYPRVLKGEITKQLKIGRKSATKSYDAELIKLCSQAINAAANLASLMLKSSATRVTADYHPEVPVQFLAGAGFSLNSVDIADAHTWPSQAKIYIKVIEAAWRQLHA